MRKPPGWVQAYFIAADFLHDARWSPTCTTGCSAAGGGENEPGFSVSGSRRWKGTTGSVMKVRAALLGMLMMTATLPLGAGEKITMKVSPAVAFAPANLVVRAMVIADPENRAVEIVAESDDFYRSSMIQLDGDKAARTSQFEFRSLPPGTYEVRANLYGSNGAPRASIRQQVNVLASGTWDR
jgi:hypothetical protein